MQDFAYFIGKVSAFLGLCSILHSVPSPKVEKLEKIQRNPEAVRAWEKAISREILMGAFQFSVCRRDVMERCGIGKHHYADGLQTHHSQKLYLGGDRKGNKEMD